MPPFVKVERDRLRFFDPGKERAERRRERRQRADGAVDMKPEPFSRGDFGDAVQRVDRARVHGSGGRDDQERREAARAVVRNGGPKRRGVHPADRVDGDLAQVRGAYAGKLHRASHAFMRLGRSVGHERRLKAREAFPSGIGAESLNLRHDQRGEIRHRRAGHEHAGRARRIAQRLGHPKRDLLLDLDADVVAAAAIHVQSGGGHFGEHADRRARAVHPAHESRMQIAGRVGHDVVANLGERVREFFFSARQRLGEPLPRRLRRRPPDRIVPDGLDMSDQVVQKRVRLRPELVPIAGIEIAGRVFARRRINVGRLAIGFTFVYSRGHPNFWGCRSMMDHFSKSRSRSRVTGWNARSKP